MDGFAILGGFDDKTEGTVGRNAPTLRIRGIAVLGGVEAKTVRSRGKK
jgi:hypothetical protein